MAEKQSANVKHKQEDSSIDALPLDVDSLDSTFGSVARALLIGGAGNLTVTTLMGHKVTLLNVPAGVLPLCVKTVHTAGTSATSITALF